MNLAALFTWPLRRARRGDARRQVGGLRCSLGEVVDFSRRGLKVACPRKPALLRGMTLPVLVGSPTRGVGVTATVKWIRAMKTTGCWQIGLRIEDPAADVRRIIDGLSRASKPRSRSRRRVRRARALAGTPR